MKRLALAGVGSALALSTVAAVRLGGWAVVTVENPPDYLIAGKATELTFTIRQHGASPLSDLRPSIQASSRGRRVTGNAWALLQKGGYRGTITVPDTGSWQITIQSGFGSSKATLLPIAAVGTRQPHVAIAEPERGRRLFAAKGCVTCHVHGGVDVAGQVQYAPDLTNRRFPADYLAKFLADPSIKTPTMDMRMSNLGLNQREIAALVAFINSERKVADR
jgi:cytochrome c2